MASDAAIDAHALTGDVTGLTRQWARHCFDDLLLCADSVLGNGLLGCRLMVEAIHMTG